MPSLTLEKFTLSLNDDENAQGKGKIGALIIKKYRQIKKTHAKAQSTKT